MDLFELGVVLVGHELEEDRLVSGYDGTRVPKSVDGEQAVRWGSRRAAVGHQVHVEAVVEQVQGRLQDTHVGLCTAEHDRIEKR